MVKYINTITMKYIIYGQNNYILPEKLKLAIVKNFLISLLYLSHKRDTNAFWR